MSRFQTHIVAVKLRRTTDPRTSTAAAAWQKLEQRLAELRAKLPPPIDLRFGSAAKS